MTLDSLLEEVKVHCRYWQWPILVLEVQLLMCSKMADGTNLSSKLPIPDRTREEESSVSDARSSLAFRWAHISSASLNRFVSYSPASLLMRPRYFPQSSAICSHDSVGMLKSLKEALRVSLYRFFWPPWECFPICSAVMKRFFGKRSTGILVTWPVHLNCASFRRVFTVCIFAFVRTSVFGILSCHLIFRSFLRQLVWKCFSTLACRL